MTAASPVTIRKIGIIGAGRIGCGIAHVCAVSGFDVYLVDISTEALERALSNMTDSLEHQVSVTAQPGWNKEWPDRTISRA